MNSVYDAQTGFGAALNPGANQVLASTTVTLAGYYRIDCYNYINGTLVGGDTDNTQLVIPGDPNSVLIMFPNTPPVLQQHYAQLAAGATVSINTIGAGSILSVYHAKIAVTLWPRFADNTGRTS